VIERVLLSLTQVHSNLIQVKERVEETTNSINHAVKNLEELKDELSNDVNTTKDLTPRCRQERGILKRVREEIDDEYQRVSYTRREKKKARVTWER
jgi:archaellum component FlaC